MHMDVVDLRGFYRTVLGGVVRRLIVAQIRRFWPDVSGLDLALIGYGAPYGRAFLEEAASVCAFMPAPQGVAAWPRGRPNASALVAEAALPARDGSFDRVLLVHGLEPSEMPGLFLDEVWRVLKPQGQILVVVPNRRGIWAGREQTPFGTGRPFSRGQLAHLLSRHHFAVEGWTHGLFVPPMSSRFVLRSATVWERVGRRLWPGFSGVLVMAATKEVPAVHGQRRALRLLQPVADLVPSPSPARTGL